MPKTLVLISDTHRQHREITVPEGDILIHAGDITGHGDRTSDGRHEGCDDLRET